MEAEYPRAACAVGDDADRLIPGAAVIVEIRDCRASIAVARVEHEIGADRGADLFVAGVAGRQRQRDGEQRD